VPVDRRARIAEALLEAAIRGDGPVVRMYQWDQPTLSLGYFQKHEAWMSTPPWSETAMVRRLTGGGAILHDREWTYSCVIPGRDFRLQHPYDLYDRIHHAIVDWTAARGISLRPRGENRTLAQEPYLCYLRGDSHDLCLGESKIVGSAQRRRKGALLQHGSLLLQHSPAAPHIFGVHDLLPNMKLNGDMRSLGMTLASVIGNRVVESEWTSAEINRAEKLGREKYQSIDWDK
jgi:lipoyl(octanoyl) transferase